jgi:hypothetical protein
MTDRHTSPFQLDAWHLGLLEGEELRRVEAHTARCPICSEQRDAHRASVQRFGDQVLARTAPAVRSRLAPRSRRRWWAGALVLSAAAALLWLRRGPDDDLGTSTALRFKGPGSLQIFARRQGRVFPVAAGTVLAPGDAIRFFLHPSGLDHVIVGSVDGAGKANIYYPYGGARSARLDPGRRLEVPGSIILDGAPGPERVFAVFSRAPLAADQVRAALAAVAAGGEAAIRSSRTLPLPDTSQASVQFEKGEPGR